jgi:hypothetical protein
MQTLLFFVEMIVLRRMMAALIGIIIWIFDFSDSTQ